MATLRRDNKGTVVVPLWEIQGPEQQLQSSENLQLQLSFRPTNAKVAYLEGRVLSLLAPTPSIIAPTSLPRRAPSSLRSPKGTRTGPTCDMTSPTTRAIQCSDPCAEWRRSLRDLEDRLPHGFPATTHPWAPVSQDYSLDSTVDSGHVLH